MTPIEIPPGVVATPTKASKSSNWQDTQLIRWVAGKLQPIGGWDRVAYNIPFESRIRVIHEWFGNNGIKYTAYLCEAHCYVDVGGVLFDITPDDGLVAPYADDLLAGGYGDFTYGYGDYGTPRPDEVKPRPITPSYTMDNWGEELRVMTSADGRLLAWDPSDTENNLVAVTNAPTANRTFVITPERFIILFGMGGDFRSFGWCDQEDDTNWNFSDPASKAGEYQVEPSSPILDADNCRDGVLFHTAFKTYIIRYVGLPYVYSYEELTDITTPFSAAAFCATAIGSIWVTDNGFWQFNGSSVLPLECPVWTLINDNIDPVYSRYEASAVDMSSLSEFWFMYPSKGSRYNDRYVIYNYREGWWAVGKLPRSCGFSASYTAYPIMADGTSVFLHESSANYPDAPELPYADTFALNIASGAGMMTIRQLLPDIEGDVDNVKFQFFFKNERSRGAEKASTDKPIRSNGYVEVRETGRDFRMRVKDVSGKANVWTVGQNLIDAVPRGQR